MKKKTSLGLEENIEGLLTYVLGWITGIVFLILEKDNKFVRFHAMQSTITFLGITIISLLLYKLPLLGIFLNFLLEVFAIILWILCMIKAYEGEKFKLPIVGDIAEKHI